VSRILFGGIGAIIALAIRYIFSASGFASGASLHLSFVAWLTDLWAKGELVDALWGGVGAIVGIAISYIYRP
jgi:hypothetical protein